MSEGSTTKPRVCEARANAWEASGNAERWRRIAADAAPDGRVTRGEQTPPVLIPCAVHGVDAGVYCPDDPPRASNMTAYNEIMAERAAQDRKWGGPAHDDQHRTIDWIRFIAEHLGKAGGWVAEILDEQHWFTAHISGSYGATPAFRPQMVRVAALAVAAIESFDRRSGARGSESHDTATGYARAQLDTAIDEAHAALHALEERVLNGLARVALEPVHEALHRGGAGMPRVGCATFDPEAQRLHAEMREMLSGKMSCGHTYADLIGGTESDGRPAVTKCGACLASRQDAIKARREARSKLIAHMLYVIDDEKIEDMDDSADLDTLAFAYFGEEWAAARRR